MRRLCFALLVTAPLALVPFTGAAAQDGAGNKGGSDRSYEVRQNGSNGGGGTGTPDAGDNMHPSGNDKSVEAGGSYPQGNSPSDPDGMTNGGADKPGGTGGVDQDDQDGNNGCGNDDDFEDDNNGLCLGKKKAASARVADLSARYAAAGTPFNTLGQIDQILVVPESAGVDAAAAAPAGAADSGVLGAVRDTGTRVLGVVADAGTGALAAASGILPTTGAGITTFTAGGLALIAAGWAALRYARTR